MSRRKRKSRSQFSLFAFQDIITCVMGIMLLLTLMMCLQITSRVGVMRSSPANQLLDEMQQQARELAQEALELETVVSEQNDLFQSGAIDDPELLERRVIEMRNEVQLTAASVSELVKEQTSTQETLRSIQSTVEADRSKSQAVQALQDENQSLEEKLAGLRSGNRVIYNSHDSSSSTCWIVELTDPGTIQAAEIGKTQKPLDFQSSAALQTWMVQRSRAGAAFLVLVKPSAAELLEPLASDLRSNKVTFGFDLLAQDMSGLDPVTGAAAQ